VGGAGDSALQEVEPALNLRVSLCAERTNPDRAIHVFISGLGLLTMGRRGADATSDEYQHERSP
jgi:hypothetical protein